MGVDLSDFWRDDFVVTSFPADALKAAMPWQLDAELHLSFEGTAPGESYPEAYIALTPSQAQRRSPPPRVLACGPGIGCNNWPPSPQVEQSTPAEYNDAKLGFAFAVAMTMFSLFLAWQLREAIRACLANYCCRRGCGNTTKVGTAGYNGPPMKKKRAAARNRARVKGKAAGWRGVNVR